MATTATITPTLGSAPVTLQAGSYSAIDDRRFWSSGFLGEGFISSGSYKVIQRAAGANMTVDVQSATGNGAIVQGDSVTAQGCYHVPPTSANVNVDIAAADVTNPRNDLVVLEVKDDQHDAGGLNLARVRVITGTPNASAALTDNPGSNGTPALPSSCFLLAVVRVAAAATTVATAAISDRRFSARSGFVGSTTITTSTAINFGSFATVGSAIDCGAVPAGRKLLIQASASFVNSGAATNVAFGFAAVSAGSTTNTDDLAVTPVAASAYNTLQFQYIYTTTAGTLTIQLRARKYDNVAVTFDNTLGTSHLLSVTDVTRDI